MLVFNEGGGNAAFSIKYYHKIHPDGCQNLLILLAKINQYVLLMFFFHGSYASIHDSIQLIQLYLLCLRHYRDLLHRAPSKSTAGIPPLCKPLTRRVNVNSCPNCNRLFGGIFLHQISCWTYGGRYFNSTRIKPFSLNIIHNINISRRTFSVF